MVDLVLKGGEVIDPSRDLRARLDLGIRDGAIAQIAPTIEANDATQVVDVSGKLVVPGLIDLHTHVYEGVNQNGINPDLAGVRSGVTTVVDAGSAGCYTFGGFSQYVVPNANTRIVSFLHAARTGLSYQPEISGRDDIDLDETVRVVTENRPLVQGVKLRAIGPSVPTLGMELFHLAKRAARDAGVRLMVHIGDKDVDDGPSLTRDLLPLMEPGDILTHLFTDHPGRILDGDGRVMPEVLDAQDRGVALDTAFGRFNFSFDVAKRALDGGVKPRTISTDMTPPGRRNTVHSLTEMLGRFLALDFSLEDVISMVTVNPAAALGMEDSLGSLVVGRTADVTVLEATSGDWVFLDTFSNTVKGDTALVPVLTVKGGEPFTPDWGPRPWGWLPQSASS
jgi:dihydroorotase